MKVIKGYHCAFQTHYHLVFPVKYRKALLCKEVEEELKQIVKGIGERYEIEFESIGCDKDHIHILCSFHPKYSIGEVVRKFKSITARELFSKFPWLKEELWGGELWSDGYYAATVGERGNWVVVEKYVKAQGSGLQDAQLRLF
jgi:putative transposase